MAKIRIKRTSVVKEDPTLLAGELGISGDKMYYGPKGTDVSDNDPVAAIRIAGTNINNTFIGENTFRNSEDSILFQNGIGTTLYKVRNGKLQAVTENLETSDLVPRSYVDDKIDGAIAASDALILKGTVNGSTGIISSTDSNLSGKSLGSSGSRPVGYRVGWSLKVSVAGTILGNQKVEVGDLVVVMKVTDATSYSADDFHIFQTNVDFSTLGTNIAKLSGSYGLVGSSDGGVASIVSYPKVKERLGLVWGDIGGTRPFPEKDHTHAQLKLTHKGINKYFILSIDEASGNSGAPSFSLVDDTSSVLKGQDYSDRFQFETSRAKFTFKKPLYVNGSKVSLDGHNQAYTTINNVPTGTILGRNTTGTGETEAITYANLKSYLSLNNVTNESKATMFANPTFTGTATAAAININGAVGIRASALSSAPTQILVVSANPSSTTRTIQTRTPAQILSDIGAEPKFEKNKAFNKNFGTTAGTVAEGNHTHDDRYYTETEIDTKLGTKENSFAKNSAFNKKFGTTAGTVAEGDHTHFDLVLKKTSSDAGQATLSLFQKLDGGNGSTIKNGIRFFHQAGGSDPYLEIAKTSSGAVEFNSDFPIYFKEPIDATIDCGE